MAWSWLQSAGNASATGTTVAATFTTANCSSGSTLIAAVACSATSSTSISNVKDGAGNSFIQIATASIAGQTEVALYALNTPAGDVGTKPTITATISASNSSAIMVAEVSGIITSSTAAGFTDGTAGTSTGTATGSIGPPTYSSSAANEFLVYLYGDNGVSITWTDPSGYTGATAGPGSGGAATGTNTSSDDDVELAYKNSTGGTETGTYSLGAGSGVNWGLILVAFKLAPATAPASVPLLIPPGRQSPAAWALLQPPYAAAAPAAPAGPSGTVQPYLTVARRSSARAVWRGYVSSTTNLLYGNQPGGLVRRRAAARGRWAGQSTPQPHLPGAVQPRATVPVPRREAARAVTASVLGLLNAHGPAGSVQPRAAVPVPRRYPARALWRGPAAVTTTNLTAPAGQRPHGFTSSRRPVGGLWGGLYTPQPNASGPPGAVQPRATVPVPRRTAARAAWRGPAAVTTVNATTSGPAGTVQPRTTVPVPRRNTTRAVSRSALGLLNAHGPSGTVQPRATVPVPRRYPSRPVWRGNISLAFPNGTVQPWPTIPVPRRKTARAVTASILGLLNAHGPAGTIQPRATVPVPRRADTRAVWASTLGPANAHGGNGTVQPQATRQPRRTAARAVTHWTPVATVNGSASPPVNGTVQPAATAPHRPHAPPRAVWRGTAVPPATGVQVTGGRVTRRGTARAVIHAGPAPFPPPSGTIQAETTAPVRHRPQARVIWRGQAVPGQQPKASTGGLVRRRSTARGLWHGNAGAAPPSAPAGTPATGGRVVTRRPPNRGQWHGTPPATANATGPAVPAPRQRPRVTSRATARGSWRGSASQAGPPRLILFTPTGARQLWATTGARQTWQTGTARQTWNDGTARN